MGVAPPAAVAHAGRSAASLTAVAAAARHASRCPPRFRRRRCRRRSCRCLSRVRLRPSRSRRHAVLRRSRPRRAAVALRGRVARVRPLLRGACRLECRRGAPCFLGRCGILARTQRPETRLVQRRRAHVLGRITSGRGLGCSAARCLCSHPRVRPSCPPRQRDAAGCDVSSSADRLRGDDGRAPTELERRAALRRQRRRRSHPPRHWPR